MTKRKIVVTGSGGFLGSHLLDFLKQNQNNQIDRLNVSDFDPGILKDADVVVHLAAINDSNDPNLFNINFCKTFDILDALSKVNTKAHFVFASSFAAYKPVFDDRLITNESEIAPRNFYGLSKMISENFIKYYKSMYGINYSIIRLSNLYGPGLNRESHSVISKILFSILDNKSFLMDGDGSQSRDFLYVSDAVEVMEKVIDDKKYGTFNVCSEKEFSIKEILDICSKIAENKVKIKQGSSIDLSKWNARNDIKFSPTDIYTGIKKTWESIKK